MLPRAWGVSSHGSGALLRQVTQAVVCSETGGVLRFLEGIFSTCILFPSLLSSPDIPVEASILQNIYTHSCKAPV